MRLKIQRTNHSTFEDIADLQQPTRSLLHDKQAHEVEENGWDVSSLMKTISTTETKPLL